MSVAHVSLWTKRAYLKLCHEKRRKKESVHKWINLLLFGVLCLKDFREGAIKTLLITNKFSFALITPHN